MIVNKDLERMILLNINRYELIILNLIIRIPFMQVLVFKILNTNIVGRKSWVKILNGFKVFNNTLSINVVKFKGFKIKMIKNILIIWLGYIFNKFKDFNFYKTKLNDRLQYKVVNYLTVFRFNAEIIILLVNHLKYFIERYNECELALIKSINIRYKIDISRYIGSIINSLNFKRYMYLYLNNNDGNRKSIKKLLILRRYIYMPINRLKYYCNNIFKCYSRLNRDRDKLIEINNNNIKLFTGIIGININREDLLVESILAAIKVLNKFNYYRNNKFVTYSSWYIKQSIKRLLNNNNRLERINNKLRLIDNHNKRLKDNNKIIEIIKVKRLEQRYIVFNNIKTIINNRLTKKELIAIIDNIINYIDDRDKMVLLMRFNIDSKTRTLKYIGNKLMLSKERVRQIERGLIVKINNKANNLMIKGH